MSVLSVAVGSLWYQSLPATGGDALGIAPDGTPMYESRLPVSAIATPRYDARPRGLATLLPHRLGQIHRN